MSSNPIKNIDIKEYLSQRENQNVTIIDVREKSEIAETGILPGGVNIPVGEIADALQKDETNFKQLYSINKPSQDDPIIFSCRSGKRSMMASETAKKLGYNNIMNLSGGWMAWEQHNK